MTSTVSNPPYYPIAQVQQKIAEVEGCWWISNFANGLAGRVGLYKFFWNNERDFPDLILKSLNMDFDGFIEIGALAESNINILTSDQRPVSRKLGSAKLRGILCKTKKEDPSCR